jgi:hypothetical protein
MSRSRSYVRQSATLQERLDRYTDKSAGADGCWPWNGALTSHGYGELHWQGHTRAAHRLSFETAHGPIPDGAHILYRCDNPRCVNPAHLVAGSHLDNMRDMIAKGRAVHPRGERNGKTRLTAEMALAIRQATGSYREIGARFGVSERAVRGIKRGRVWKHLPAADAAATVTPTFPIRPAEAAA